MLANTVPLYNISTLCNKNKKQICNFSETSKSCIQRFEEPQFGHHGLRLYFLSRLAFKSSVSFGIGICFQRSWYLLHYW